MISRPSRLLAIVSLVLPVGVAADARSASACDNAVKRAETPAVPQATTAEAALGTGKATKAVATLLAAHGARRPDLLRRSEDGGDEGPGELR